MLRVLIIDDEAHSRDFISALIRNNFEDISIVGQANSVRSGIKAIRTLAPEIVLLDIKLPDGTGFDLLAAISEIHFRIIFITAFSEHALRAFRVNAVDYLLKPIEEALFISAIEKARQTIDSEQLNNKIRKLLNDFKQEESEPLKNRKFKLKAGNQLYLLNIDDVIRLESDKNYTIFYLQNREPIIVTRSLKEFEKSFMEYGFVRVHKSHIVNRMYVVSYHASPDSHLLLNNDSIIPVSIRKKSALSKLI
ncbi:MAG: LytTR family DNA-binding domain-containing protein [Bacteroidales bacterium]|nr:LytTR family DNA-binding domain-containing protein [Bacteroidales bacterium]